MSTIDFAGLAAALLSQAETLVPEWLPGGKRSGAEYACGDLSGGKGRSCSVNLSTGLWSDFAAGTKGGDLTSLYAAQHSLTQLAAARELAGQIGYDLEQAPRTNGHAEPAPREIPAEPAPPDAPLPEPPGLIGRWAYFRAADEGAILVVCRLPPDSEGRKQFRQYTWRAGRWTAKGLAAPRPLYRLPLITAHPQIPVVLCEGEKACQAAQQSLPDHIVSTWSQGAQSVAKTDFTPLARRQVILWPDADDAGRKAMAQIAGILLPLGARVSVIPTADRPAGWDAADADPAEIPALLERAKPVGEPPRIERHSRAHPLRPNGHTLLDANDDGQEPSAHVVWQQIGISAPGKANGNGIPHASLGNAHLILMRHPKYAGHIWLDTFRGKIYHDLDGRPEPWTDAQSLRVTNYINSALQLPKIGIHVVQNAIDLVAANNPRNSVAEYLEHLVWDHTERLSHWLSDCLGVTRTPYTLAVARNWLISMVARAYRPGCQADHMPVLEGLSGTGKSSTIAILGGEWYRAAPQDFGSKAFIEVIQGAWLVEIPDMVGFGRREHTQIIAAITTRSDPYRAAYGRIAEDHPRTCIFAATSETDDYLQDSRGIRRYWPLPCTEIQLDVLCANRDQLFAEAVTAYKAGEHWHEVPAQETREEQSKREVADAWRENIQTWLAGRTAVTVAEVAEKCLSLHARDQDQRTSNRIANCLKSLGYIGKVERLGMTTKRVYRNT